MGVAKKVVGGVVNTGKKVTDKVKDKAEDIKDNIKEDVEEAKENVKESAEEAKSNLAQARRNAIHERMTDEGKAKYDDMPPERPPFGPGKEPPHDYESGNHDGQYHQINPITHDTGRPNFDGRPFDERYPQGGAVTMEQLSDENGNILNQHGGAVTMEQPIKPDKPEIPLPPTPKPMPEYDENGNIINQQNLNDWEEQRRQELRTQADMVEMYKAPELATGSEQEASVVHNQNGMNAAGFEARENQLDGSFADLQRENQLAYDENGDIKLSYDEHGEPAPMHEQVEDVQDTATNLENQQAQNDIEVHEEMSEKERRMRERDKREARRKDAEKQTKGSDKKADKSAKEAQKAEDKLEKEEKKAVKDAKKEKKLERKAEAAEKKAEEDKAFYEKQREKAPVYEERTEKVLNMFMGDESGLDTLGNIENIVGAIDGSGDALAAQRMDNLHNSFDQIFGTGQNQVQTPYRDTAKGKATPTTKIPEKVDDTSVSKGKQKENEGDDYMSRKYSKYGL